MKHMTGKCFLDTHMLQYCYGKKNTHKKAASILLRSADKNQLAFTISTQVLKEFTSVMISKLKFKPKHVKEIVNTLCQLEVVHLSEQMISDAIDIHILNGYSIWDSLILVAAIESKCKFLISEDMHHKHKIGGLTILNPFQK